MGGVELLLENESLFMGKVIERWGNDIGQEAAFWTLHANLQGT